MFLISQFHLYVDELCKFLTFFLLQVTRCLVDVLSKALSKPDSHLDPECKDILLAGLELISHQFAEMFKFKEAALNMLLAM